MGVAAPPCPLPPGVAELPSPVSGADYPMRSRTLCSRPGRHLPRSRTSRYDRLRRAAGVLFPGRYPRLRAQTRAGSAGGNS
jgi:hypothetical protein